MKIYSHVELPGMTRGELGWFKHFATAKELQEYVNQFYDHRIKVEGNRLVLYTYDEFHRWSEGKPSPVSGR